MRIKTPPGMARFDYKLNLGKITPEQAKGLKYVDAAAYESKMTLTPKQANMFMKLMIKIHKEQHAERERKAKKLGNLLAQHGMSHEDIDEML